MKRFLALALLGSMSLAVEPIPAPIDSPSEELPSPTASSVEAEELPAPKPKTANKVKVEAAEELPAPRATEKKKKKKKDQSSGVNNHIISPEVTTVEERLRGTRTEIMRDGSRRLTTSQGAVYVLPPVQTQAGFPGMSVEVEIEVGVVPQAAPLFQAGSERVTELYQGMKELRFPQGDGSYKGLNNSKGHLVSATKLSVCRPDERCDVLVNQFGRVMLSLLKSEFKVLADRKRADISKDTALSELAAILTCKSTNASPEETTARLYDAYSELVAKGWADEFETLKVAAEILN